MTPFGSETQTLFRLLADGAWHDYADTLDRLARAVPPGKAIRKYLARVERRRERENMPIPAVEPNDDEKQSYGARLIANQVFNSVKNRYLDVDHGDRGTGFGRRMMRLKPNVELPGLNLDGRSLSGPSSVVENPERVVEPLADESESEETQEGEDAILAELEASGQEPSLVADRAAEIATAVTELIETNANLGTWCEQCELFVMDPADHTHFQSQAAPEPPAEKDEMALFSEAAVRQLVAQEVGMQLDAFQNGLQVWLADRFEELHQELRQTELGCAFQGWTPPE